MRDSAEGSTLIRATPHDPHQSWTSVGSPVTRADAIERTDLLGFRLSRTAGLFAAYRLLTTT